ncbi:protein STRICTOSIDINE SYNTHASE-LIKE 6-like [Telopea speciosissima]|uniref:protein STRICTOSIDINE SYNTHASE-LIKE 6-like n=1 Tax=Telopea speciosissima TaxID=54955 RepID=UPI001CC418E8|nr:protein STRICTOSIDINE SYNTHASE-LIKE 6-like [Telopea speciosissima]
MANSKTTMLVLVVAAPVAVALLLYRLAEFDPASLPEHVLYRSPPVVPSKRYGRILESAERVGEGLLPGPEDLAYDSETGHIYTGCSDGWIKRLHVADSAEEKETAKTQVEVENWAFTGGRPLGLAFGPDKQLIVADAYKGLLRVSRDGAAVELLTDEVEGLKFKLTDGVDVGRDGVIYFTDASYKYGMEEHNEEVLEGSPYGRLMSYDPSINETRVLVRHLYFANGVALSPDQDFLIFCETIVRRCSKYHIQGEKRGTMETFIDNLPGFPDNIRYDGEGCFWIALTSEKTSFGDAMMRYPKLRKTVWMLGKVVRLPRRLSNGGVMGVNLEGEAISLYSEPGLFLVTGGIKIRNQLYIAYLTNNYITRVHLNKLV